MVVDVGYNTEDVTMKIRGMYQLFNFSQLVF